MPTIVTMMISMEFTFISFLLISGFLGLLAFKSYRRHEMKEFAHLTELWASLGLNALIFYLLQNDNQQILALSMVGWLWPLRTMRLVLEDFAQKNIVHSWEYIALATGGFVSVALGSYGFPFAYYAFPFAFSVGLVGLNMVMESYKKMPKERCTSLHKASFILIGSFFIVRLCFPFWRVEPVLFSYAILADLLIMVGLGATAPAVFFELLKDRHQKVVEDIMKERNEKLVGNSKYSELGMMAAGIAHEINNPLAVIQARTTQLLRIYKKSERQQELSDGLQQILYTSERINRTIQGVREFVHQDDKGRTSEVQLKDLVDDVLAFCGQRMKNHGVSMRFYGLENLSVWGNKIQLEQILLNLFNNSFDAIEYLPDKWIELSVHQNDDKVQMFIKDSGYGIPPEIAVRIMEPFYSTKEIGKGTGLGLALARGIAEKHGGSLQYLDNTGHTTFLLELPKAPHEDWGLPLVH